MTEYIDLAIVQAQDHTIQALVVTQECNHHQKEEAAVMICRRHL